MSDDQRHDCMGCAGHPFIDTPGMDRLAEEGVRFTNAFTVVPLCAPSRASCLTGAYPHVHGVVHNKKRIRRDVPTWPSRLQEAGYRTALIGKHHFGGTGDPEPGFDRWVGFPGQGSYMDPVFNVDGLRVSRKGYHTDLLAEYAIDFLKETGEEPWALCLWYKAPHAPFIPPPRHRDAYADADPPKPPAWGEPKDGKARSVRTGHGPGCTGDWVPDGIFQAKKTWDDFARDYVRTVRGVDDALSTVLDYLDRSGQAEDTLVIHTADHGFFHGEFGLGNKRWLYDPAVRIPYLIRYPALVAGPGRQVDDLVTNLDLVSTIYDVAGVRAPDSCQGLSLRANLSTERAIPREAVFIEYFYDEPFTAYPSMHCVRTRSEKLIRYERDGDISEYYDLLSDPAERHNLAGVSSRKADVDRMTRLLEQEMSRVSYTAPDLTLDYAKYVEM